MIKEYQKNANERLAQGIPPLPLSAEQTAELIELLKKDNNVAVLQNKRWNEILGKMIFFFIIVFLIFVELLVYRLVKYLKNDFQWIVENKDYFPNYQLFLRI